MEKSANGMVIHIDLANYTPKESESYHIEYWYNRQTRDWVVQVFDNYNREQDSEYCPDKAWRDSAIQDFSKKYNTTDIRKV